MSNDKKPEHILRYTKYFEIIHPEEVKLKDKNWQNWKKFLEKIHSKLTKKYEKQKPTKKIIAKSIFKGLTHNYTYQFSKGRIFNYIDSLKNNEFILSCELLSEIYEKSLLEKKYRKPIIYHNYNGKFGIQITPDNVFEALEFINKLYINGYQTSTEYCLFIDYHFSELPEIYIGLLLVTKDKNYVKFEDIRQTTSWEYGYIYNNPFLNIFDLDFYNRCCVCGTPASATFTSQKRDPDRGKCSACNVTFYCSKDCQIFHYDPIKCDKKIVDKIVQKNITFLSVPIKIVSETGNWLKLLPKHKDECKILKHRKIRTDLVLETWKKRKLRLTKKKTILTRYDVISTIALDISKIRIAALTEKEKYKGPSESYYIYPKDHVNF